MPDNWNWEAITTVIVGFFAIYLYLKQKRDHKKDAALLILQEIRFAEQKIRQQRAYKFYKFSEKLLPTNNWNKNIHLFISDLSESELDLISRFYAHAEYLDIVIKQISDIAVTSGVEAPQRAKDISDEMRDQIELILNSPAVEKLSVISERKWYRFGL
jgi:hypothetical protein